jgi:hypothetical protein
VLGKQASVVSDDTNGRRVLEKLLSSPADGNGFAKTLAAPLDLTGRRRSPSL